MGLPPAIREIFSSGFCLFITFNFNCFWGRFVRDDIVVVFYIEIMYNIWHLSEAKPMVEHKSPQKIENPLKRI